MGKQFGILFSVFGGQGFVDDTGPVNRAMFTGIMGGMNYAEKSRGIFLGIAFGQPGIGNQTVLDRLQLRRQ